MKKHALLIAIGLAIVFLFIGNATKLYQLGFISLLENKLYDTRLSLTLPTKTDDNIVILDIDEKSLKAEGRWPWGRDKLALLMDKLFDHYQVAVVGFDVVFAERDNSSGLNVLQELAKNQLKNIPQYQAALAQIKPQLDYDDIFSRKLKNRNIVLGYYFNSSNNISGALPPPAFETGSFSDRTIDFTHWNGFGANLDDFQNSAQSGGHFNPVVDPDGVVRRIPMIVEYGGAYYESLSLAVSRLFLGTNRLVPGYATDNNNANYAGLEWLELVTPQGSLTIPVDSKVSTLVPYQGGRGTFQYIPITDVLNEQTPVESLKNKIILVGTSAPGLMDMRATPVDEVYPGVEIHANMISGILQQSIKSNPTYTMGVEVILILVIGITLSFLLPLLSPVIGVFQI